MKHYKTVQVDGVQVRLHRHLMEVHLGRSLGFNEVVHHINGNKHDNRLENLEVVSRSDHMRMHPEILERWKEENTHDLNVSMIAEMYQSMTIGQIANEVGVSAMTIWYRLKKAGIPTRKRGSKPTPKKQ